MWWKHALVVPSTTILIKRMKNAVISFLVALLIFAPLQAQYYDSDNAQPRKKVAVVLSGGGALGAIHVGALKVIEESGIPVDMVVGTSMGSIVGALYSVGYKSDDIAKMFRTMDWVELFLDRNAQNRLTLSERDDQNTYIYERDFYVGGSQDPSPGGVIRGTNVERVFGYYLHEYADSINFLSDLPRQFACVATDLVDDEQVVLSSGSLVRSIRSSMSIPGVFTPVRMGDQVLVDGGLRNNYPADIAKEMGADYIIGVSVAAKLRTAERLNSTGDILLQIVDFNTKNKFDENMAITDIPINVNTEGYSTASFTPSAIDTLIQRGEDAAMEHWDEIVALKEKLFLSETPHRTPALRIPSPDNPSCRIGELRFENMTPSDETFLRTKFKLREGDSIDSERANLLTISIRLDLFYQSADYRVENNAIDMPDGTKAARITLIAGQPKPNKMSVGIRFDSREMVALQSNIAFPLRKRLPMQLDFTFRMGKHIMAKADWELHPTNFLHPTLSVAFHRNDINLYEYGTKAYNHTYNRLAAEVVPLSFYVRNFHISLGAAFDYFFNTNLLLDQVKEHQIEIPKHEHFFSYFARVNYNSENNWYFPTRGSKFWAKYGYYTDNLVKLYDEIGMHEVSMMWRTNFPIGEHLVFQPMLYGRLLHCKESPIILSNILGGEWFGHYIDQQLPFAGMGNMELQWDKLFVAQMQAQYSLTTNNIMLLKLGVAQDGDKYKEVLKRKTMLGGSVGYYYNSPTGPVGASLGYSNVTNKLTFYFNLGFVF